MKKTNQFYRLKTPVDAIWQVRLTQGNWQRIVKESEKRETTYSWVVRYCVFRLANQIGFFSVEKLKSVKSDCKLDMSTTEHPLHRLQLCLYGDDAVLLQTVAIHCGLSVSMLIRIALKLFLHKLENNHVSKAVFFWHGIKFIAKAVAYIGNLRVRPYSWSWSWQNFSAETYYDMPEPVLGCFFRTSPLV